MARSGRARLQIAGQLQQASPKKLRTCWLLHEARQKPPLRVPVPVGLVGVADFFGSFVAPVLVLAPGEVGLSPPGGGTLLGDVGERFELPDRDTPDFIFSLPSRPTSTPPFRSRPVRDDVFRWVEAL